MRNLLQDKNWRGLLETYFADLYDASLVDLIFYVPQHGDAKHELMWRNKSEKSLRGRGQIWVLVFSEIPLRDPPAQTLRTHRSISNSSTKTVTDTNPVTIVVTSDSAKIASISNDTASTISTDSTQTARETVKDSAGVRRSTVTALETRVDTTTTISSPVSAGSLTVSLTSLDYKKDRFLGALVKALFGGAAEPTSAASRDTSVTVRLRSLGWTTEGQDTVTLYVAQQRFNLAENTRNRVSIHPGAPNASFPNARGVHFNFANHSASRFGAGLGGGLTFDAQKNEKFDQDGRLVEQGPSIEPALYLFGHFYLKRPKLPLNSFQVALSVGTNLITGDILDNIVLGGTIGRVSDLGLVGGIALIKDKKFENDTVKTVRNVGVYIGVDFAL